MKQHYGQTMRTNRTTWKCNGCGYVGNGEPDAWCPACCDLTDSAFSLPVEEDGTLPVAVAAPDGGMLH